MKPVFFLLLVYVTSIVDQQADGAVTACYFTNWSQYRQGDGRFTVSNVDPFLCTHIIYAFAAIDDAKLTLTHTEWNDVPTRWDKGTYDRVTDLKHRNSNLKVLLSVNGSKSATKGFSAVVQTKQARRTFIDSVVSLLRAHNFDGIDLGWEYHETHNSPREGFGQFCELLKEMHTTFLSENRNSRKKNLHKRTRLTLSTSLPATNFVPDDATCFENISKYVDFVISTTYDYYGDREWYTMYASPLYSGSDERGIQTTLNINYTVSYLLRHIPRDKLVLAVPTFAKTFELESRGKVNAGAPTVRAGKQGHFTGQPGLLAYYEVCGFLRTGWRQFWDPERAVPFATRGKQWIGYEDTRSMVAKAMYARNLGLRGVAVWALDLDDFRGVCGQGPFPLISAINNVLHHKGPEARSAMHRPRQITDLYGHNFEATPFSSQMVDTEVHVLDDEGHDYKIKGLSNDPKTPEHVTMTFGNSLLDSVDQRAAESVAENLDWDQAEIEFKTETELDRHEPTPLLTVRHLPFVETVYFGQDVTKTRQENDLNLQPDLTPNVSITLHLTPGLFPELVNETNASSLHDQEVAGGMGLYDVLSTTASGVTTAFVSTAKHLAGVLYTSLGENSETSYFVDSIKENTIASQGQARSKRGAGSMHTSCSFQTIRADPADCRYFYQCSDGLLYHFFCGTGAVFDPNVKSCVSPNTLARCAGVSTRMTEPNNGGSFVCEKDGYYRDAKDCNKFYRCADNVKHYFSCPDGLVFDEASSSCDYPDIIDDCRKGSGPKPMHQGRTSRTSNQSTSKSTHQRNQKLPKVFDADQATRPHSPTAALEVRARQTNNPGSYDDREMGISSQTRPHYDTAVHKYINDFQQPSRDPMKQPVQVDVNPTKNIVTNIDVSMPSPSLIQTAITEPVLPRPIPEDLRRRRFGTVTYSTEHFDCPRDGYFRDPGNCRKFFQCANGLPYHVTCNGGLVFNEFTGICDWPYMVQGCAGGSGKDFVNPRVITSSTESVSADDNLVPEKRESTASPARLPPMETIHDVDTEHLATRPVSRTEAPEAPAKYQTNHPPVFSGWIGNPVTVTTSRTSVPVLVSSLSQSDPYTECRPQGYRADPEDCRVFYICSADGTEYQFRCAEELVFNIDKGYCETPTYVPGCQHDTGQPTAIKQSDRPSGSNLSPYLMGRSEEHRQQQLPAGKRRESTVTLEFRCPQSDGVFRDRRNCSKVYECVTGKWRTILCPTGTVFNSRRHYCDLPSNVPECRSTRSDRVSHKFVPLSDLGAGPQSTNTQEEKDQDPNIRCLEDGFIKDPSDCTVFFKCRHGRSTRMQCVEGLGFRADLRACDWKEFVESCTNEPETTTKTSVLTTRMDSPTGDSSLESQDTPANQVVPTTVAGRGNIVPAPDVSAEGFQCPHDGLFRHPYDCHLLYECVEGGPVTLRCSEGLVFSGRSQRCEPIQKVPECFTYQVEAPHYAGLPFVYTYQYNQRQPAGADMSKATTLAEKRPLQVPWYYARDAENPRDNSQWVSVPPLEPVTIGEDSESEGSDRTAAGIRQQEGTKIESQRGWRSASKLEGDMLTSDSASGRDELWHSITAKEVGREGIPAKETNGLMATFACTQAGMFADPEDCQKFFRCSTNLEALQITCPGNLVYNERSGECDFPANVPECFDDDLDMAARRHLSPTVNPKASSDPGRASKKRDSKRAKDVQDLQPVQGKGARHDSNNDGSAAILTVTLGDRCETSRLFPDPTDCSRYYQCVMGYLVVTYCEKGKAFNRIRNVCDHPAKVPQCGLQFTERTPDQARLPEGFRGNQLIQVNDMEQKLTTPDVQIVGHVSSEPQRKPCPDSGYMRHDHDCSIFYYCNGPILYEFQCAAGLAFDPARLQCEWPEKVAGCGQDTFNDINNTS